MEQSTAQRRLVKSPPELWAEVSSEASLGRRLAQFGEIRITRVEPETTVAWEGNRASGTVELAPAGWGTKVILTATPLVVEHDGADAPEPLPAVEADAVGDAPEPKPAGGPSAPEPAGEVQHQPEPVQSAVATVAPAERRRGFFARLFRRAAKDGPPAQGETSGPPPHRGSSTPAPGPEPSPPDPGLAPTGPAPALRQPSPPARPAERPLDTKRTVAILSDVLDDLGAAHHRPFSRD